MFEKVLIADRGEVVFRIARTCERMGVATCAVFVEADAGTPHATACDESACIGAQADAYRDVEAVIAAAQKCGAQAIHPGYGALGQDPASARAIAAAGLTLVAPSPEVLEKLCDPLRVRDVARLAGVRALPVARLELTAASEARAVAAEVGYPLRVLVQQGPSSDCEHEDGLDGAVELAIGHARHNGQTAIWFERCVHDPRLLAVQLVADATDQVGLVDLERSVQLIAEAPAPALWSLRGREVKHRTLAEAALRVAREGGLTGPGIAEFQLDSQGRLFFCALTPGLPAEHALAEMCCGLDLVDVQLRIAAGEVMPAEARRAQPTGHAAESYVLASETNPAAPITTLRWPMVAPGCLRVETELAVGHPATPDASRLVAKIASYGQTRHQALLTLDRVLAESMIAPLATNLDFLRSILADEAFRAGQYDSGFIARLQTEVRPHS